MFSAWFQNFKKLKKLWNKSRIRSVLITPNKLSEIKGAMMAESASENEELFRKGDFERLCESLFGLVEAKIISRLNSSQVVFCPEDVKDIRTEVWTAVKRRDLLGLANEYEHFKALVLQATRFAVLEAKRNFLTKRIHAFDVLTTEILESQELKQKEAALDPSIIASENEEMERLETSMEQLADIDREVLLLSMQKLSYKEIAERLQISLGCVKSRLNRARERFKAMNPNQDD